MKHLIIVVIDEDEFDGRIYDEGENSRYDMYSKWMDNSTEAGRLIEEIKDIVKEWGNEVNIDGGSLLYPNGIMFETVTMLPADMAKEAQHNIEAKVKTQFDLYTATTPINMKYSVKIEAL